MQFRFVSDFTASNEVVRIDNIEISETVDAPVTPDADGDKGGQYDVEYIAGIPVLQPVTNDKLVEAIADVDGDDDDLLP